MWYWAKWLGAVAYSLAVLIILAVHAAPGWLMLLALPAAVMHILALGVFLVLFDIDISEELSKNDKKIKKYKDEIARR